MSAPIALFVYNRPDHTRRTVDALQKNEGAEESDLFVFSDAPKSRTQLSAVKEVRKYISQIKGFKSLQIIEREKNFGLAKSIIEGVSFLCEQYGRVIVLEDDLVTSKYFLQFMNRSLDIYQNEPRIMQITGFMFPVRLKTSTDAIFLPFVNSWGWATWARAWQYFDPLMKEYSKIKENKIIRKKFDVDGSYPYFKLLESQIEGNIDSWAIRWHLSVFMKGGLTLYPVRTFVQNIGKDGSGTHFKKSSIFSKKEGNMKPPEFTSFPIERFPEVQIEEKCYRKVREYFKMQQSFISQLKKIIFGE